MMRGAPPAPDWNTRLPALLLIRSIAMLAIRALLLKRKGPKPTATRAKAKSNRASNRLVPALRRADDASIAQNKGHFFPPKRQSDWNRNQNNRHNSLPYGAELIGPNLLRTGGSNMADARRFAPVGLQPVRGVNDGVRPFCHDSRIKTWTGGIWNHRVANSLRARFQNAGTHTPLHKYAKSQKRNQISHRDCYTWPTMILRRGVGIILIDEQSVHKRVCSMTGKWDHVVGLRLKMISMFNMPKAARMLGRRFNAPSAAGNA